MTTPNVIQMAARFYDARDSARMLLREKYEDYVGPWRRALAASEIGYMKAAIECAKALTAEGNGHGVLLVLAAVADLSDMEDAKA